MTPPVFGLMTDSAPIAGHPNHSKRPIGAPSGSGRFSARNLVFGAISPRFCGWIATESRVSAPRSHGNVGRVSLICARRRDSTSSSHSLASTPVPV